MNTNQQNTAKEAENQPQNTNRSRRAVQAKGWVEIEESGGIRVRIYRRKTASGNYAYFVDNKFARNVEGKRHRRLEHYAELDGPGGARERARKIARDRDNEDYDAARLSEGQAREYIQAASDFKKFGLTVREVAAVIVPCLKDLKTLDAVREAVKFYKARHKQTTKKTVKSAVTEFLKIQQSRGASDRYYRDLKGRLERFVQDCNKHASSVTTADVQEWLDGMKLKPQSYRNFRTVLFTFFKFCVARAYAVDNPVEQVERVKVKGGDIEIFTPSEIARLLETAKDKFPAFLPCVAIGAFAGLRSAEIERLEWSDIHLGEKFIVVSASKAKTASRRIVPISDNLSQWLADYGNRDGRLFSDGPALFHNRQRQLAAATGREADAEHNIAELKPVQWVTNGLRHSYASYRFAQINDAGRVAGELGNSAAVVHRHYREIVRPAAAVQWFNVVPETPANVVAMPTTVTA